MPIYYPSVAVNMTMRFDEALLSGNTPAPTTPTDGANKTDLSAGGASAKSGLFQIADSQLSYALALVPRTATIEIPTYRQAQKFTMAFNFRDFPIDPRAIRALGVEIYIGTVTGDNWARGMRGEQSSGRLASQIQLKDENRMLVGIVDSLSASHSEKGSEVVMEGHGVSSMFLSAKVNAQQLKKLNVDQSIDGVVKQLLAMDAQGKDIPVRIGVPPSLVVDWPNGVPKVGAKEILSRIMKGADGQKANLPMKGDPNTVAVWDVITNLCNIVGAVPYFIGHELWIRPAKSIFQQQNAGQTGNTPFKDGAVRTIKTGTTTQTINFRKMVYGRDLNNINLERKFGPTTVPQIRVVSIDNTKKGKSALLEALYPEAGSKDATRTTVVSPGGGQTRTEITTIAVPGITDKTRLAFIAEQIWHEIGRGELKGTASTKDLASLGGDNDDADIIRLRPGDAIELLVDASGVRSLPPVVSELNTLASMSTNEAIKSINDKLGGNQQKLAEVLVGSARGTFQGLQSVFRVNNVKYSWDLESGIGVDFDFQNYIEARYGQASETYQPITFGTSPSFGSSGG